MSAPSLESLAAAVSAAVLLVLASAATLSLLLVWGSQTATGATITHVVHKERNTQEPHAVSMLSEV